MTKDEVLRLALEALELVSIEFVCNGAHHTKKDRHEWLDPCPIVGRYKDAISAVKAALANEALERKAENAKELGLDYEPWEKFCDSNCVWTDHHPDCKLAKDEPVAWMYPDDLKRFETSEAYAQAYSIEMVSPTQGETVPLYTTPPQRTWIGLTDEEIDVIYEQHHNQYGECESVNLGYERAIEAKLKEKNT